MKCYYIFVVALVTIVSLHGQQPNRIPVEVYPGLIIEVDAFEKLGVPIHSDQIAYVVQGKNRAVIRFVGAKQRAAKYSFRAAGDEPATSREGEGELYEKFQSETARDGSSKLRDIGGKLIVAAGAVNVEWSYGNEQVSYIYYNPKDTKVYVMSAIYYDRVQVGR